jgi:hypothetical protein
MHSLTIVLLLVIGPALALGIGCVGVELIEDSALGWALLAFGAGYPPGAVIYYRRRQRRSPRPSSTRVRAEGKSYSWRKGDGHGQNKAS